jgi:hypothetical protein
MIEVMVVVIYLGGRKLSLVHDVFGGKGANVETLCERNGMCGMLTEDVELSLEMSCVESAALADITITVMGTEDDEWLVDGRFLAASSRAKNGAISWNLTPAEDPEAQVVSDLGENRLIALQLHGVVGFEKDIAYSILSRFGERATNISLGFPFEKLMRDGGHGTCTITISTVGASCTSVGHGAQELTGIGNDLVCCDTFDMANETYTTSIFLVLVHIQSLVCR